MKIIIQVFCNDLKGVCKHPFSIIVFVGIMLLPSLYAWFNIDACWDPYSNTGNIAVAVVNLDEGAKLSGVNVKVGDMVTANLAKNKKMGWEFTGQEEAVEGVQSGKYYAAVVIPKEFSTHILSVATNQLIEPKIEYYVNEKKNAVAPKITDKGIDMIQEQVNQTFIETATEAFVSFLDNSDKDLGGDGSSIANTLVERLELLSDEFTEFDTSVTAMKDASLAIKRVLKATDALTPDAKKLAKQTKNLGSSSEKVIAKVKTMNGQLTGLFTQSVDKLNSEMKSISHTVNAALVTEEKQAKTTFEGVKSQCTSLQRFNSQLTDALNQMKGVFPDKSGKIEALRKSVNTADSKISQIEKILSKATSGKLASSEQKKLTKKVKEGMAAYETIRVNYEQQVKPLLTTSLTQVSNQLDTMNSMMVSMESLIPKLSGATKQISKSIDHTVKALNGISKMMNQEKKKLDTVIKEVKAAADSEKLTMLMDMLERDPSITAKFMSSPVEVKTHSFYPVKNYGSAMSPFYTILCLWVGACILVAILKVRIKGKEDKLRPYQAYFGRYMIFMFAAIIQSVCVCLGDLYLLKIQCENPVLFVLAGVIASICFSLVVYTLTISFGDVGKAIAIILLVIQVAGAGGTFPIEVLPGVFQKMNPYMPFTYGINAMRECVAGMYGNAYWIEILKMCICIPVALFIGLVLRRPLITLNHYLEKKLDDTNIM